MREMSSEMATLLKSKKMVGDNRATHEVVLGDGKGIIINPFTAKCLRGTDGVFEKDIQGRMNPFYTQIYGGGDFVTRADGKILLTYQKDMKIMLSVLDTEEEIIYMNNQSSLHEWELLTLTSSPSYSDGYTYSTFLKLKDGKLLLFIAEPGDAVINNQIDCYVSVNGLGTDFIYISTLYSYTLAEILTGSVGNTLIGKGVELPTGRILIPLTVFASNESVFSKLINKVAISDDSGITWVIKNLGILPPSRPAHQCKGFSVFDNGITRQIVAIIGYDWGSMNCRMVISNDDGLTWDYPAIWPIKAGATNPHYRSGIYQGNDGYVYLIHNDGFSTGLEASYGFRVYRRATNNLIDTSDRYNLSTWQDQILEQEFGDDGYEKFIQTDSGRVYLAGTSHYTSNSIVVVTGMEVESSFKKLQAKSIGINRTNGMSSSLNIEFDNKNGVLAPDKVGEYEHILWPNKEIIVKQGYGNELMQTFKGLTDTVDMATFPQTISISARDNLKRALDQTVSTILGEHVLTFVGMQVEDMFISLANMAGLPLGIVEETGIAVAEKTFSWETYGDAFSWLSELVGFEVVCDEEGLTHFRKQQIPTTPTISYEFVEGEDIISLGYTINDTDLYRDIIVHGKKTVVIDEKEVDEVIEFKKVFSAADYWGILPQKILKIDAPEATTLGECEQIALKAEYLMISRARVVRFQSIGIPHLQIGDFIRVTESSSTVSEVYRITDLSTNQDSNTYTMDITCHWYSAGGVE